MFLRDRIGPVAGGGKYATIYTNCFELPDDGSSCVFTLTFKLSPLRSPVILLS
jgi:hypothetical protein